MYMYYYIIGMAKRKCNDHAKWLPPDFSDCVSDEYTNLNEDVSIFSLIIQAIISNFNNQLYLLPIMHFVFNVQ